MVEDVYALAPLNAVNGDKEVKVQVNVAYQ